MRKITLIALFVLLITICNVQVLLIYGGSNHDVFLGALNTSKYDTESIWNPYGNYGSAYSNLSPFNLYANDPPVIVDYDGNFYGYFIVNKYASKRANFQLANIIYEYYQEIREDVGRWYDEIID